MKPQHTLAAYLLLLMTASADAQTQAPLPCKTVDNFISQLKTPNPTLKGDFIKQNLSGEEEYAATQTLISGNKASYHSYILVDELGGITTTSAFEEKLWTGSSLATAKEITDSYLAQLKLCGFPSWETTTDNATIKEYRWMDYDETDELYLYLGYEPINPTTWTVYLYLGITTTK